MVKVYGCSDDLVEIEGSKYKEDEIGCFEYDVRLWFDDGTVIRIGYPKRDKAIWFITIVTRGSKVGKVEVCNDEDAPIYSDIYTTEAEVVKHELIPQRTRLVNPQ